MIDFLNPLVIFGVVMLLYTGLLFGGMGLAKLFDNTGSI